jgi:hypothetical protein
MSHIEKIVTKKKKDGKKMPPRISLSSVPEYQSRNVPRCCKQMPARDSLLI